VKSLGGIVLGIGLASFGVLAWVGHKLMSLERIVNAGDVVVLSVFAVFGGFCSYLGWLLFRTTAPVPSAKQGAVTTKRVTLSQGCAAAGVLLLILSVLIPADWHPVVLLFLGLALLAVSHALTPCVERLEQLRRARESMRQL
jgi:hypothetical protein